MYPQVVKRDMFKLLDKCVMEIIHVNLFITQFIITRFLKQNNSKMDPKNV